MVRLIFLLSLLLLAGCKPALFSSASCNGNCPNQIFSSQSKYWNQESLSKISENLTGFLESSILGNHKAIWIDTASQKLVFSMPSPNVFLDNWSAMVPELPGAQIRAYIDSKQHSFIEVRYPLYLLSEKFESYKLMVGLPSGEALPGVPQGKTAMIDIQMDKTFTSHLYFAEGIVAILVDVPFDPMLKTSIPIKKNPMSVDPLNTLGYVSTVPKENLDKGGIFMSVVVPTLVMELLRQ